MISLLFQIFLSINNLSGTLSADTKGIYFETFSDPVTIVRLPTNQPEFVQFALATNNKLRIGSNATVACTDCTQDSNINLNLGEIDLGHAWAYNDKTWHSYFQLKTTKGSYLSWTLENPPQGLEGFLIQRSQLQQGPYALVGEFLLAPPSYKIYGNLRWLDPYLTPDSQAYYRVIAFGPNKSTLLTSNTILVVR